MIPWNTTGVDSMPRKTTKRVHPITVPQPVQWGTTLTDWHERLVYPVEKSLKVTRPGLKRKGEK